MNRIDIYIRFKYLYEYNLMERYRLIIGTLQILQNQIIRKGSKR